jgi:hypothetical protein
VSSNNATPESRVKPFFSDADIQWTNGRTDIYKSQPLTTNNIPLHSAILMKFGNNSGNASTSLNIETRSRNPCCRGKVIINAFSECVSVTLLSNLQAICALLCSHMWPAWFRNHFSTLPQNRHEFRKKGPKNLLNIIYTFRIHVNFLKLFSI